MNLRSLENRVALVTGSTDGLGLAVAEMLAGAGCSVALHGLAEESVMVPVTRRLESDYGVNARYYRADLADPGQIEGLIENVVHQQGNINILVNNAVVRHFAPMDSLSTPQWDNAIAVNISAAFHTMRLVVPGMRSANFGRIFNMVSVYGLRGTHNRIDYVASKSALVGMTRAVALEHMDFDVTCHAICPGSVLTPGTDARVVRLMAERAIERPEAERIFLEGKQPTGRFIDPASVGSLMLLLCGPAGRDMTGGVLPVEGGWLAAG